MSATIQTVKENTVSKEDEMKGSEKQIKWAEDIIEKAMTSFDDMIKNYDKFQANGVADVLGYSKKAVEAAKADMKAVFAQVDKASDIIDIRNKLTYDVLKATVINAYM